MQFFDKVWLDHNNEWAENILNPTDHMPGYGAHVAKIVSMASLVLMESRVSETTAMEALLRGMLQVGIDTFGLYNDGRDFIAGGGKRAGRKWPMFFAGLMFNQPAMSVNGDFSRIPTGPYNGSGTFPFRFKEDDQVYVDGLVPSPPTPGYQFRPDWQGSKWKWCSTHAYGGANLNFNDSAPNATTPKYPQNWGGAIYPGWQYDHYNNESYRFCCSSAEAVGFNLAARMMPGGIKAWQNQAFFGYFDRYMLPLSDLACQRYDDIPGWTPHRVRSHVLSSEAGSPSAADLYVLRMWQEYRWAHHQEGVVAVYPLGFRGTEFDCSDTAGVPTIACVTPQATPVVRRRRYPVLVCHDRPVVGESVYAEVFDMPPNSIVGFLLTLAGPVSGAPLRLFPSDCACVAAAELPWSLCGTPAFGDVSNLGNAQVLPLTNVDFGHDRMNVPIPLDAATVNLEWVLQGLVFHGASMNTTNAYHFRNLAQ